MKSQLIVILIITSLQLFLTAETKAGPEIKFQKIKIPTKTVTSGKRYLKAFQFTLTPKEDIHINKIIFDVITLKKEKIIKKAYLYIQDPENPDIYRGEIEANCSDPSKIYFTHMVKDEKASIAISKNTTTTFQVCLDLMQDIAISENAIQLRLNKEGLKAEYAGFKFTKNIQGLPESSAVIPIVHKGEMRLSNLRPTYENIVLPGSKYIRICNFFLEPINEDLFIDEINITTEAQIGTIRSTRLLDQDGGYIRLSESKTIESISGNTQLITTRIEGITEPINKRMMFTLIVETIATAKTTLIKSYIKDPQVDIVARGYSSNKIITPSSKDYKKENLMIVKVIPTIPILEVAKEGEVRIHVRSNGDNQLYRKLNISNPKTLNDNTLVIKSIPIAIRVRDQGTPLIISNLKIRDHNNKVISTIEESFNFEGKSATQTIKRSYFSLSQNEKPHRNTSKDFLIMSGRSRNLSITANIEGFDQETDQIIITIPPMDDYDYDSNYFAVSYKEYVDGENNENNKRNSIIWYSPLTNTTHYHKKYPIERRYTVSRKD